MLTATYSVLHMLVDGICALAMFGRFIGGENGYYNILIYNFCAFALQMPLGVLMDMLSKRQNDMRYNKHFDAPVLFAVTGLICTFVGALFHPVVLGLGNAFFHVGGGVGTIREDFQNHWKGKALGIFVAPGAFGLYVGTQIAKQSADRVIGAAYRMSGVAAVLLTGILLYIVYFKKYLKIENRIKKQPLHDREVTEAGIGYGRREILFVLCCLIVVIIRSYVGMAVTFPWKKTMILGLISVLAVVFGKMAGGILAARFGNKRVVILSLAVSAVCFLFYGHPLMGILALFCFNMTMPITLYLLVKRFRDMPGFFFGVLTFGLFLGFLFTYMGVPALVSGRVTGVLFSGVSMGFLLLAVWTGEDHVSAVGWEED
ncbi:MAG: hypothetical protein EOM40_17910 [Clostridia bacterium]|nr:hypothetical protein [Clostridia bacterium]NCC44288.1 hypothetical protein [Clostridia bacterium]